MAGRKVQIKRALVRGADHAVFPESVLQRVFPLHTLKQREVRKHLSGAEHYGRQRIVRNEHRQPGLGSQSLVEVRE
jgi:hypothetical protein